MYVSGGPPPPPPPNKKYITVDQFPITVAPQKAVHNNHSIIPQRRDHDFDWLIWLIWLYFHVDQNVERMKVCLSW